MSRLPSRAFRIGALVLALAITAAGVAFIVTRNGSGSNEPEIGGTPAWIQIRDRVAEEGVTPQLAIDWFATLIAPVPGARPLSEPPGVDSGTQAIRFVLRVWDQLQADQQRAITDALTVEAEPSGMSHLGAGGLTGGRRLGRIGQASVDPELRRYVNLIASRTGVRPRRPIELIEESMVDDVSRPDEPAEGAILGYAMPASLVDGAWTFTEEGPDQQCVMVVRPAGGTSSELQSTILHEVFHCVQADSVGGWRQFARVEEWIVEGAAEFMTLALPTVSPATRDHWVAYIGEATSLYHRSYDAVGFFAQLEDRGVDTWKLLMPMADRDGGLPLALEAAGSRYLTEWAAELTRQRFWGPGWDTALRGTPEVARRLGPRLEIAAGTEQRLDFEEAVQFAKGFRGDADTDILQISGFGYASVRWNEEGAETLRVGPEFTLSLCVRGDCSCEGHTDGFEDLQRGPSGDAGLAIALTHPYRPSHLILRAVALPRECDPLSIRPTPGITIEGPHPLRIDGGVVNCTVRRSNLGPWTEVVVGFVDRERNLVARLNPVLVDGTWLDAIPLDWGTYPRAEWEAVQNEGRRFPSLHGIVEWEVADDGLSGAFRGRAAPGGGRASFADGQFDFSGSYNCGNAETNPDGFRPD